MARDYINIGCSSTEEPCIQLKSGDHEYIGKMKDECTRFKDFLIILFGPPPGSAKLTVKHFNYDNDDGYYEVIAWYTENDENELGYALHLESNIPNRWSDKKKDVKPYVPNPDAPSSEKKEDVYSLSEFLSDMDMDDMDMMELEYIEALF